MTTNTQHTGEQMLTQTEIAEICVESVGFAMVPTSELISIVRAVEAKVLAKAAAQQGEPPPTLESLTDLIAERLSGTYHCLRVWEAWHVGTMSQDDFEDVGESDTPGELAAEILAILSPVRADVEASGWKPIESAPKDGRVITVAHMKEGEPEQQADMQWGDIQRNGLFPGAVGMWVCPGGNFTWNPEPAEFGPTHWRAVQAPAGDRREG